MAIEELGGFGYVKTDFDEGYLDRVLVTGGDRESASLALVKASGAMYAVGESGRIYDMSSGGDEEMEEAGDENVSYVSDPEQFVEGVGIWVDRKSELLTAEMAREFRRFVTEALIETGVTDAALRGWDVTPLTPLTSPFILGAPAVIYPPRPRLIGDIPSLFPDDAVVGLFEQGYLDEMLPDPDPIAPSRFDGAWPEVRRLTVRDARRLAELAPDPTEHVHRLLQFIIHNDRVVLMKDAFSERGVRFGYSVLVRTDADPDLHERLS